MAARRSISFIARRLLEKIRYGLFLQVVHDYLWKINIVITPFYWMKETIPEHIPDNLLDNPNHFEFSLFDQEDITAISQLPEREFVAEDHIQKVYSEGKKCFGAKINGEIAGFTWFNLDECASSLYQTPMNANEAYLFDMYVLKAFRGKSLAPLLRYKNYELLKKLGRDTCYSITVSFNTPSARFKKKLNAQFVFKGLYVGLFKKYERMWILKRY